MNFVSIRVITDDVRRLVQFYERATGLSATWANEDFAELATPSCTLAIGGPRTMPMLGAGAAGPSDYHSPLLEFLVDDVDRDYERLRSVTGDIVLEPTTMPWGNRSLLFRDPDGNMVNFFTPVTPQAIKKFADVSSRPASPAP